MAKNETDRKPLPPYIPFKTLLGFVQKLKDTIVPPRVDSTMLRSYSGSVARQLVAAMKWLQLLDDNGHTNEKLRQIVAAYGTDTWSDVFGDAIFDAYREMLGDLDLDHATTGMLADKFRAVGADGQVLQKCMTFFLAALRNAGVKVSPLLSEKAPRQRRVEKKTRPDKGGENADELAASAGAPPPSGMVKFSFPIPDKSSATIILPADVSAEDWDMVSSMVGAYIARSKKV